MDTVIKTTLKGIIVCFFYKIPCRRVRFPHALQLLTSLRHLSSMSAMLIFSIFKLLFRPNSCFYYIFSFCVTYSMTINIYEFEFRTWGARIIQYFY